MINYRTRIRHLKAQIKSYVVFLKSGETEDEESELMLIMEISRVQKHIDLLESKPISELSKKPVFWEQERESQLNFTNLTPRDVRVIATK